MPDKSTAKSVSAVKTNRVRRPSPMPRAPGGKLEFKPEFKGLHNEKFLTETILGDVPDDRKDCVFAVGLEHGNSTIGHTVLDTVFLARNIFNEQTFSKAGMTIIKQTRSLQQIIARNCKSPTEVHASFNCGRA